jgi:hypothetical protein
MLADRHLVVSSIEEPRDSRDMPEITLTTTDIENKLQELQHRYGISTLEFQTNPDARARVSDEDEFEWDAYIEHQYAIKDMEETLHREYLQRLGSPLAEHPAKPNSALLLAA